MASVKFRLLMIACMICVLNQCKQVQSSWIKDKVSHLAGQLVTDASKVFQSSLTRTLCPLKTVSQRSSSFPWNYQNISNRMS